MKDFLSQIGVLRVMHGLFLASLILTAPFSGGEAAHSGLAMWPTMLAPALVPIFIFVLPLDMTMAAVSKDGAEASERQRLNRVIRYDLVLLALLIISWLPFFLKLVIER